MSDRFGLENETTCKLPASERYWSPHRSKPMNTQQTIQQIAQKHLGIETLETRKSDQLDFHDLAVWCLEAALKAAFEAGQKAAAVE